MISLSKVVNYMKNDCNILIVGERGTGKTHTFIEASKVLGLKMKYYNVATLDPWTDLVGIPVPNQETKTVEYFRPRDIDEAEVLFFDELNRPASDKTLNSIFEIIQFGTINGEPLPNLKLVVAAINPMTDDYNVEKLDEALVDRFDVYLATTPYIDVPHFTCMFNADVAMVVKKWWDNYEAGRKASTGKNKPVYISPRRMEIVTRTFSKMKTRSAVVESLPTDFVGSVTGLVKELTEAFNPNAKKVIKPVKVTKPDKNNLPDIDDLLQMEMYKLRTHPATIKKFLDANFGSISDYKQNILMNKIATALSYNVGKNSFHKWVDVYKRFDDAQFERMSKNWPQSKINTYKAEMLKHGFTV